MVLDWYFVVGSRTGVVLSSTGQYEVVLDYFFVVRSSTGVVLCSTE